MAEPAEAVSSVIRAFLDDEREWMHIEMAVGLNRIYWILTVNEALALAAEITRELDEPEPDRGMPVEDA